jgi:hypothetical protein
MEFSSRNLTQKTGRKKVKCQKDVFGPLKEKQFLTETSPFDFLNYFF